MCIRDRYGGVAGGSRAAIKLKSDLSALEMVPLKATVVLPFFSKQIDDKGTFSANAENTKAAEGIIKAIKKYLNK